MYKKLLKKKKLTV